MVVVVVVGLVVVVVMVVVVVVVVLVTWLKCRYSFQRGGTLKTFRKVPG